MTKIFVIFRATQSEEFSLKLNTIGINLPRAEELLNDESLENAIATTL